MLNILVNMTFPSSVLKWRYNHDSTVDLCLTDVY